MFSANVFLAEHDFPPKNGPVPSQPVTGYGNGLWRLKDLYVRPRPVVAALQRGEPE
jgi:hypothetical protein